MKKFLLLVGVAALAAGAFAVHLWWFGTRVDVLRVERRDVVETVVASGRVAAPHRVDVGSRVVGTVSEVPVLEGQTVRAGDVLIRLEDAEARADLAQAKATLANAQAQYERNRRLTEAGFLNKSALDNYGHQLEVARSQARAARARLDYATIRAPRNGVLIARHVERGDVVQPGKALMVLSPAGETQIVLQIDERNLARLRLGQPALASTDAFAAERFPAELVYINPGIDAQRGTVEVKLGVPAPPAYLRQDMTVSADIEVGRVAGALTVAAEAIRRSADGAQTWVLRVRDGRAERREVALGLRAGALVEVRSGLEEGDLVLPAGERAVPGARVRPRPHG